MANSSNNNVRIKVVGVGGAGGNAVLRMARSRLESVQFLAVNTDVQALSRIKALPTFAIGPNTTKGMGAGGNADVARKAAKESQDQMSQLLEGQDMVFVTAGMGGGTGTGAAPLIADLARRHGALTVGVVTRPFSFEGAHRSSVADRGIQQIRQKVDTLIVVDNDRLLTSLDGVVSLDKAFQAADEVLRQGVQGISELITVPGLINVDFADVRTVIRDGGPAFMAIGEGKGKHAATDAVEMALRNPLFDMPVHGASGILLNIKGGRDLKLAQVEEVAGIVCRAAMGEANVILGVAQDRKWSKGVAVTLLATGLAQKPVEPAESPEIAPVHAGPPPQDDKPEVPRVNGHATAAAIGSQKLL